MLPTYATTGSAGADLIAREHIWLGRGDRALVPTGVYGEDVFEHSGWHVYCGLVVPRSGFAANHGITVLNAPGLIDPDYKDEIKVSLINHGWTEHTIEAGVRIAQLLLVPFVHHRNFEIKSTRRNGGFGSTGE